MAAEAHEQVGHRFQRVQQMKRRDAAAGALRQAVLRIAAQHEHRPVQPLHQAAGDDAEHAAMPVLGVVNQRRGGFVHRHLLADLADLGFHLLALGILIVKLLRQLARARRVGGEKQLDHALRGIHAAGRVDARRNLKGHLARVGRRAAR